MKAAIPSTIVLLALLMPLAGNAAFPDVPPSHPYAGSIDFVQTAGIVSGYPDGTFGPANSINRAEFTKIIVNATGKNIEQSKACFSDVDDEWFSIFVCTAKNLNIIGGYLDGTFHPERPISFAEAAKIISLAYDLSLPPATDTWFERFVLAMEQSRAIPTSITALDASLTRGEMAEMIARLLQHDQTRSSQTLESLTGRGDPLPAVTPASSGASSSEQQERPTTGSLPFTFAITQDWPTRWHLTGFTADNLVNPYHNPVEYVSGSGDDPAFLRLHYPEGSASPFVAHNYNKPFGGVSEYVDGDYPSTDHIVLRYDIRIPTDFPFHTGGVLPGVYGCLRQNPKGGMRCSADIHWDRDGRISLGGLFMMATGGGTMLSDDPILTDGKWHTVQLEAKMNEGKSNRGGYAIVSIDGKEVAKQESITFRTNDSFLFDGIDFTSFFSGLSTSSGAPHDTYVDIANIVLMEK